MYLPPAIARELPPAVRVDRDALAPNHVLLPSFGLDLWYDGCGERRARPLFQRHEITFPACGANLGPLGIYAHDLRVVSGRVCTGMGSDMCLGECPPKVADPCRIRTFPLYLPLLLRRFPPFDRAWLRRWRQNNPHLTYLPAPGNQKSLVDATKYGTIYSEDSTQWVPQHTIMGADWAGHQTAFLVPRAQMFTSAHTTKCLI